MPIQQGPGGQSYKLSRSGCGRRLAVLKVVVVPSVAPLQPLSSELKGSCHLLINLSSGTRDHFLVVGSAGAWKQGAAWRLGGLLCLSAAAPTSPRVKARKEDDFGVKGLTTVVSPLENLQFLPLLPSFRIRIPKWLASFRSCNWSVGEPLSPS